LEKLFRRLEKEGRAKLDWSVQVPVCGLHLQVPYAYKNGVWNLVKPDRFSAQESQAMGAAIRLAIEGGFLQRHGTDDLGEKKLIVIPSFDRATDRRNLEGKVGQLLTEYHVDTVPENAVADFAAEVEETAHSS
jgi:hypothetical protein